MGRPRPCSLIKIAADMRRVNDVQDPVRFVSCDMKEADQVKPVKSIALSMYHLHLVSFPGDRESHCYLDWKHAVDEYRVFFKPHILVRLALRCAQDFIAGKLCFGREGPGTGFDFARN